MRRVVVMEILKPKTDDDEPVDSCTLNQKGLIRTCCMMSSILYFLDTTTSFTRHLHSESFREIAESMDGKIKSAVHSLQNVL
ncbi:hypothetical protein F2Q69_00038005 [Brassica cretica]|uniref:Uncharacterized protein n=1 Tax=Brassica cretica TaxID=69181 RepID=A0A8S9SN98_BRACR|nr:hypothetical protein F2Q69_00038005 [Brassica cretica]